MATSKNNNGLTPEVQASFYYRLKAIRELYFHEALGQTVKSLSIHELDDELRQIVPSHCLQKLARFSLRGEVLFPTPLILKSNPFLVGYYRLLHGYSQKEFYSKGGLGIFKAMEEKGRLSKQTAEKIDQFCSLMAQSGEYLVTEIDSFSSQIISDLQLLTLGPQFRGSKNNEYGQLATQKVFSIIREIVHANIKTSTETIIELTNNSNRVVKIEFSSDPDIEISEQLSNSIRPLISIEIKGGRDFSNIHNRIGEAEKSHQKAKGRDYFEFMTIINVEIDYKQLKKESPTTSHFFNLDQLMDVQSKEYLQFRENLSSILGING